MRSRRDFFDIPKKLNINEELSEWADSWCDKKKISFAAYVRFLMTEHKKRIENELSLDKETGNRPKTEKISPQSNGLYTAEQVALLIKAVTGK